MKYLLLLLLIYTNFVMGQEYDKGFIARNIENTGDFTHAMQQIKLNPYYTTLLYETLRNAIKPDNLDKKIAKQFYEHAEQCAAFVKYSSDTRKKPLFRRGNKELLKTCLNNLKEDDFITIGYEITRESPLYEIVSNKYVSNHKKWVGNYKKTNKNEHVLEHLREGDVIPWLTRNTRCNPNDSKEFECRSTFFAKDYMEMIEEFEKKQ